MPSLRLLWMALILVLVVPLYGQVSCNRNCPPSSNPCERSVGRSLETNQCVYGNNDGASCDYQGAAGGCFDGQCLPAECAGVSAFGVCDEPQGGGPTRICMDFQCVLAAPDDPCVKAGVGRINCCSDDGCSVASGAYCNDPLDDGVSCDPTGIEPAGQAGQDGLCIDGTCVATTGLCAGLSCPTIWEQQCSRDYCNPQTGECQDWWVDTYSSCLNPDTNSPGFCRDGQCIGVNDDPDECNGETCVSGPCVIRSCTYPCALYGDRICEINDYFDQTPSCIQRNRDDGDRCVGEPGTCLFGNCALGPCEDDSECDDGNPCTENTCNPLGGLCDTDPVQDDTSCGVNQAGEVIARCENGQCLPDLCLNRDCGDGDSCTDDVCNSPYGVCSNPTKANGEPCDGEPGQCIFGNCSPAPCGNDADCDDGNSCTVDDCDPFGGICSNDGLPTGTPCTTSGGASGECRFGRCQPVFGGF